MNLDGILGVAGAIVVLAVVATVVQSPETSGIVEALGNAFSGSISAARGR